MSSYVVPVLLLGVLGYGLYKKVNVYSAMVDGIQAGVRVCIGIFPAILMMLVALSMVRASGAVDTVALLLAPLVEPLGMPAQCMPLALLRPFSGSGGLSIGSDIIASAGPDSLVGRITAVMLGSSETSFYTIGVYSSYLKLKDSGYALPAALCADAAAFLMAAISVRLLM